MGWHLVPTGKLGVGVRMSNSEDAGDDREPSLGFAVQIPCAMLTWFLPKGRFNSS